MAARGSGPGAGERVAGSGPGLRVLVGTTDDERAEHADRLAERVRALRVFEDERGWFVEIRRASQLPQPTVQTNISFSRAGTIRGLHYHERGQDDLFVCLAGAARVVVLDRDQGETFSEDIGDDMPGGDVAPLLEPGAAHIYLAVPATLVLGTALDELERSGKGTALVNLCVGAGMGTGIIIERI